ncbi:MAG: hypothetical protein ACT4OI_01250 [Methanobacteriota archaeon]
MDPEYAGRDARAVEDPIAAIFDLAESVDAQTPKIRKMLRYVRIFVSLWIVLDIFFMVAASAILGGFPQITLLLSLPVLLGFLGMRIAKQASTRLALFIVAVVFGALQVISFGPGFFFGAVLVVLFFLGFLILELMRDLRSFFDYFALRHRVIQRVRQADPVVYVPEGADAVQRILAHLARSNPDLKAVMAVPGAVATPALVTGASGLAYAFDAYVRAGPSPLARTLGLGQPGFAVFVKALTATPTLADLQAIKRGVEDVSLATKIPPARVLAVWRPAPGASVGPEAYDFLVRETIRVRIRGATYACSVELAAESADGTYDFIPVVVDLAPRTGGTPAAA